MKYMRRRPVPGACVSRSLHISPNVNGVDAPERRSRIMSDGPISALIFGGAAPFNRERSTGTTDTCGCTGIVLLPAVACLETMAMFHRSNAPSLFSASM